MIPSGIFGTKWLHRPTMCCTPASDDADIFLDNDLVEAHDYSAIKCNRPSGMLTLRNPWGSAYRAPFQPRQLLVEAIDRGGGVFDISFDN